MPRPANPVLRFWNWLIGPPVRDHRGRKVRIIRLLNLYGPLGSRFSKLPPDINDRVLTELSKVSPWFMWQQLIVVSLLVLPPMLAALIFVKPHVIAFITPAFGQRISQTIASLAFFSVVPIALTYCSRNMSKSFIITSTLKFNHCPACGYSLETAKPDPADSCTLCPECGAAWRLPTSTQQP